MSIESIFTGLFLAGMGFVLVIFNRGFADTLGTPAFVDKMFGPGREYGFYKLLGVALIIFGFGTVIGLHMILINLIFSPFVNLLGIA